MSASADTLSRTLHGRRGSKPRDPDPENGSQTGHKSTKKRRKYPLIFTLEIMISSAFFRAFASDGIIRASFFCRLIDLQLLGFFALLSLIRLGALERRQRTYVN